MTSMPSATGGAGGERAWGAFDLDEAETAGADFGQSVEVAEGGDVIPFSRATSRIV